MRRHATWMLAVVLGGCAIGQYETDPTWGYFDGELPDGCNQKDGTAELIPVSGGYCIDATEVTQKEYLDWFDPDNPPDRCSEPDPDEEDCWNQAAKSDDFPMVCVDWCEADAYCQAQGKTLCGTHEGGAVAAEVLDDPAESQWYNACSSGGRFDYPSGSDYHWSFCNVLLEDGQPPPLASVQTHAACHPPGLSVYDLVGNVAEWVNSCDGERCWVRGGAAGERDDESNLANPEDVKCTYKQFRLKHWRQDRTGFRCCQVP